MCVCVCARAFVFVCVCVLCVSVYVCACMCSRGWVKLLPPVVWALITTFLSYDLFNNYIPAAHEMVARESRDVVFPLLRHGRRGYTSKGRHTRVDFLPIYRLKLKRICVKTPQNFSL